MDIDECQDKPCLYGGECTNLLGGFECACQPEFTGVRCQNLKVHTSTENIMNNNDSKFILCLTLENKNISFFFLL